MTGQGIPRLAGRLDEQRVLEIAEIVDRTQTRPVDLGERGGGIGNAGGASVDGEVITAGGNEDVAKGAEQRHAREDPVAEVSHMGIPPAPLIGVGSVSGREVVDGADEGLADALLATLHSGAGDIVAPTPVCLDDGLDEPGTQAPVSAEIGAEFVAIDQTVQLPKPGGKDQRLGPAAVHGPVPLLEKAKRRMRRTLGRAILASGGVKHQRQKFTGGKGNNIALDARHGGGRVPFRPRQQFADSPRPVRGGPIAGEEIGIIPAGDPVVGVDEAPRRRVERMGHFGEGDETGPVIFARPAGNRTEAVTELADRHPPGGIEADITRRVGIGEVLVGGVEMRQRGDELSPVPRPVQQEERLRRTVVRPERRRREGQQFITPTRLSPTADGVGEDGTMAGLAHP